MALTTKQVEALQVAARKARNSKDRPFVDGNGTDNLVARVRKTRKGQRSGHVSEGAGAETAGRNGSSYYVIRRAATGQGTGLHLYCSCPAQRFHAGYGRPCKHIKRLLAESPVMMAAGETSSEKRDLILYNASAILEALEWSGRETAGLVEEK